MMIRKPGDGIKRLARKKWDSERTEESQQDYKKMQYKAKRQATKAKQEVHDELYERLDKRSILLNTRIELGRICCRSD